jgi:CRP/FNR family transcriptional activator FtrB
LSGLTLEAYASAPLFEMSRPETLRRLGAAARPRAAAAGDVLLREGEPTERLYILIHGQVELYGGWHERETVLTILRPMACFILANVLLDAPALMSARALDASELLVLPAAPVRKAMAEDPGFAAGVARELASGQRDTLRALKQQKLCNGVERLADHLMRLRAGESNNANAVMLRHEKRVLASLLGMTPENLSRAFAVLRDYGVSVQGALVRLDDPSALSVLAEPRPPAAPEPSERAIDG